MKSVRKGAEDDAVDMDRPQPTEGQPQMSGAEIVGIVEEARNGHADRRRDHQPEHPPKEPGPHDRPIDQFIEVDAREFATQHCPRLSHGAPPSKRSDRPTTSRQTSPHPTGISTCPAPAPNRCSTSDVGLQGLHRFRVGIDLLALVRLLDAPVDHVAQAANLPICTWNLGNLRMGVGAQGVAHGAGHSGVGELHAHLLGVAPSPWKRRSPVFTCSMKTSS